MKAIILAAGLGTRLMPLTETRPKALLKLAGLPLLEILINKLLHSGFTEIAVNTHHHAGQVSLFLNQYMNNNKLKLYISHEEKLLDTGGGIKKMLRFFGQKEAVLVHNVDIISNVDLKSLFAYHIKSGADTTMAIQSRKSGRPLLFDEQLHLCGRVHPQTGDYNLVIKPTSQVSQYAFCGIQVIDPAIFINYPDDRFYSIDVYLKNTARGKSIRGMILNDVYWNDIGTVDKLKTAEQDILNEYYSP